MEMKMKVRRILIVAVALGALAMASTALAMSARSGGTVVTTKHTSLGTILVTSSGRTLYLDAGDKKGHPACTGGCLAAWPPLKATGTLKASGGAKTSRLGTTKAADGIKQVTYNGHPLYTFTSDTKSGQVTGEGVNDFYVVNTSGNKVAKRAPAPATSSGNTPAPAPAPAPTSGNTGNTGW
jgi:predicted lipoprotein with Yx(FWY)xxD motif